MIRLVSSASNHRLHDEVKRWMADLLLDQPVLVLGASFGAAEDLIRRLCPRPGGLLGYHRMTPLQLVSEVAIEPLAQSKQVPATALGGQALAARVSYLCRQDPGLEYYGPVADLPGFAKALSDTLRELRMESIEPSALTALGPPGVDLSRLLDLYRQELESAGIADLAEIYRVASQALERKGHRLCGGPLLLLNVAPRYRRESEFLSVLARRASTVLATLSTGDELAVSALLKALESPIEGLDPSLDPPTAGQEGEKLERLRVYLFSRESPTGTPSEEDHSLELFSAPGEARECIEIARRIRFAASEGVSFDRIAVALRSPEAYLPLLQDAFRRAAVPGHFTRGTIRPDPAGRAFLALLDCAAEGLSASGFAEYLSLGQVPQADEAGAPPAPLVEWVEPEDEQLCFKTAMFGEEEPEVPEGPVDLDTDPVIAGSLRAPAHWEQLLVDAAVIGGRERWETRLRGLVNELRIRIRGLEEDQEMAHRLSRKLQDLQRLEKFALPLIHRLAELPAEAQWSEWLQQLEELASVALGKPSSVLAVLAELRPMGEIGPVGLHEVRQVLVDRLTFLRVDPKGHPYGKVFVSTAEELAGRAFEMVFLPGLAEGIFPRKAIEDPLLLDPDRETLGLDRSVDRSRREERGRLRGAVSAAVQSLIVSYPRMDLAQGRGRVPSFYALDILRAAEGSLPDMRPFEARASQASSSRLGWPAPADPKLALDQAEFDLALLDPLLRLSAEQKSGYGRFLIESNQHLARSLRTRWRRWQPSFSEADGLVDPDPRTAAVLEGHQLRERAYSPTALQQFAACPYRFLLYAIHGLQPREEIAPLEQLDPLTRGGLFHEVQFKLFKRLRKARLLPLTQRNLERVQDVSDEVLDQVAEDYRQELAPAIPRVWHSEIEGLRADMKGWLREVVQAGPSWVPHRFEFAFGLETGPDRDPDSTEREAEVLNGIRLRGSIDLVEKNRESGNLRVTDHKTGRAPREPSIVVKGGEILQPILYGLAAEQLLGETVESGQLFYCTRRGDFKRLNVPINAGTCDRFKVVLQAIDRAVREGFLPAAPREKACSYCDYRSICGPYEERRIKRKYPTRLADLSQLRELP